ncbi:uncharacterized protein N7469_004026 [Penicillium citrinum]|uniref:FAD/NAD(P)-binding domain-containing protein n=2 Tax=Penicillium TaxID=5073 RepID=A0A9W9P3Q7_PENCI|nr:uncharacterized protein N7469_004026 [Penicillium citrinum]KAJ5234858.1 hypothetical protein N7469_004026 [Penicillium citrinum]KAJ5590480.1 hypothetical protein N7450_004452 [Penicillium hetheringtonii]KAK5800672.1 hypothetical protein VI817_002884 [Penicillium citrinum]
MTILETDALIVGAGFSGIYLLHRLRDQLHLNVKIVEAASDVGGTWLANTYPGARVDIPVPNYSFNIEQVWKTWAWSESFPAQEELLAYFRHVDEVLSVRKDCIFNSRVNVAQFDKTTARWTIKTDDKRTIVAKYFLPSVGFASQNYLPTWKGYESYEGSINHTAHWPRNGVDVHGKRVAIIGTGASGVQVTQEWAKEAAETFVFQRTPNLALPMPQKAWDADLQRQMQKETGEILEFSATTTGGLDYHSTKETLADFPSLEAAREHLSKMYDAGGFKFWTLGIADLLTNEESNRLAYGVWADRVRARVHDPVKQDLLAPLEPPHPFGVKRPSLERDYYEMFNKPSVHIVSTKDHPIVEFTPKGIVTDDGKVYEVDVIAVATGYDACTGSLFKMGIRDVDGIDLEARWKDGITSFLGMTVPGFPNMFLPYSIHSPTPFTGGPVFIELQANWIRSMIEKMETSGISYINPRFEAGQEWRATVQAIDGMTLYPKAKSWFRGANIPGKPVEQLFFLGGMSMYFERCAAARDETFDESFEIAY